MKKFLSLSICVICLFLFCSCKITPTLYNFASQIRYDILQGECNEYLVTANIENRENPFVTDCYVGSMINVIQFKLTFKENQSITGDVKVQFTIGNKSYTSAFTHNSVSQTFECVTEVISLPKSTLNVKIIYDNTETPILLNSLKTEGCKSVEDILNMLEKCDDPFVKNILSKDENFEIYIRFISNEGANYYYVGRAVSEYQIQSYLIDGNNLEILSVKEYK